MNYQIKALPAFYNGVQFRSRLEARWAYYFDLCEINWEYEPAGFALLSGNYCPDFYISSLVHEGWVEVKPTREALNDSFDKIAEFINSEKCFRMYFCVGLPASRIVANSIKPINFGKWMRRQKELVFLEYESRRCAELAAKVGFDRQGNLNAKRF